MNKIGSLILKSIYQGLWLKITYHNKQEDYTEFMISIKDINPYKKLITCDAFNTRYGYNKDTSLYYDNIIEANIASYTYYNKPIKLINKIENNPEKYVFLYDNNINKDNIIDYYIDCYKLDVSPYLKEYELIPGIDNDTILENNKYKLSDDQFKILAEHKFFSNNKYTNTEELLCMNIISIKTKKGLFVLAYRPLLLNIEKKELIAGSDILINKEFLFINDNVESKESIFKYLPEEDYYLIEDIDNNIEKILESLHNYNDTKNSSYYKETKIDNRPFLLALGKNYTTNIEAELNLIKDLLEDNTPMPLKVFFGEPTKLARRINYPIFTIDQEYNIDQINAIHYLQTSPTSYLQGPPGTGKTKTILNAILTTIFNDKTVLVCSNNNIPMDGVYNDILKLKYNNTNLLFPAIRLGNKEYIISALKKIKEMYQEAIKLKPVESLIKKIKDERKKDLKDLINFLNNYDKYKDLLDRKLEMLSFKDKAKNTGSMLIINIDNEINKIDKELELLGDIKEDEFNKYMNIDYRHLYMAIHYETASKLQQLSKPKYQELFEIINTNISDINEQEIIRKFKSYLQEPENLEQFLKIFNVIITTNQSTSYLAKPGVMFDYVLMDEAGQCNITNALIPISRGNQLLLVGDPQQLRPIIVLDETTNNKLKNKYKISQEYDYLNNSIYTAYTSIDIYNKETLLRYHYRSDKKIINFSNKKYYHNKLIPKTKEYPNSLINIDTSNKDILDESKNSSTLEAKIILNYIKEHNDENIAIITPFVRQRECIEYYLNKENIDIPVGTVHSFQGDQADTIIFSTAITNNTNINTYNWVKNNTELINVATTRARKKLIVIGNNKKIKEFGDNTDSLVELVNYVKNNGESKITDVSPPSLALGTRQISTESEKELALTINHILSVINSSCYIKTEVPVNVVFKNNEYASSLFYTGRFDLVIFEKGYKQDYVLLVVELNGPEHYTDNLTMKRDKEKKELCEKHKVKYISISRDCARDYIPIKKALISLL